MADTVKEKISSSLSELSHTIVQCGLCERLVAWREAVAQVRIRRYSEQLYWGRPVPGFGDPQARVLLVGLAPAAHGGNRTGRLFTGDRSGDWLYRALHKAGFANQTESISLSDGLRLNDCYITATVRCAPPDNKPSRDETHCCRPYFEQEVALLPNLQILIALGSIAWDAVLRLPAYQRLKGVPRPKFGHGEVVELADNIILIGSYHPSQQNTFTGRLTEPMFDHIFALAKAHL
jgi:uracil-DNA glycosylase